MKILDNKIKIYKKMRIININHNKYLYYLKYNNKMFHNQ